MKRSGSLPPDYRFPDIKEHDCDCHKPDIPNPIKEWMSNGECHSHGSEDSSASCALHAAVSTPQVVVEEEEERTTVMVRNIPTKVDQMAFLDILEGRGYIRFVRFFYLPLDMKSSKSLGYCFIDFSSGQVMNKFWQEFQSTRLRETSPKELEISYARLQGVVENCSLFANSAAVHSVEKKMQPLVRVGEELVPLSLVRMINGIFHIEDPSLLSSKVITAPHHNTKSSINRMIPSHAKSATSIIRNVFPPKI